MKRSALAILVVVLPAAAFAADVRFTAPTWEAPRYEIRLPLEVAATPLTLREVLLDGAAFGPFRVFRAGKLVDISKPLEKGAYEIVLDHAWSSGKRYSFSVVTHGPDPAKLDKRALAALSPVAGGVPSGSRRGILSRRQGRGDRRHRPHGRGRRARHHGREGRPPRPELRLFDGAEGAPLRGPGVQRIGSCRERGQDESALGDGQDRLPAERGPEGAEAPPRPQGEVRGRAPGGIGLTGENLGKTLTTPHLVLAFHPKSGQILTIDAPDAGIKLCNKAGVIHWNPDVFVPGVAWDHSFDWNPPAIVRGEGGRLRLLNARSGPMPRVKDVIARGPLSRRRRPSLVHLRDDDGRRRRTSASIAVRNDEMVLYKELFDSFMYRDPNGEVVTGPLAEMPETPFGLAHIAPPDLAWVGLVNTREKFGFFSLRLAAAASNLGLGGDFPSRPGPISTPPPTATTSTGSGRSSTPGPTTPPTTS